jgi:glycosyltransferase involved in cell wall biosynthesis
LPALPRRACGPPFFTVLQDAKAQDRHHTPSGKPVVPLVSVIIPTHNRPHLLARAVSSALAQSADADVEVLVVDDRSSPPAALSPDPRLHVLRLEGPGGGGAAARNAGLAASRGEWIMFLDDDDELTPGAVSRALEAATASRLPKPVAALAAIEVVDGAGRRIAIRLPPTHPRGSDWIAEPVETGRSLNVKQTLLIERNVLADIGGFDEDFRSRVHTELFLRLGRVCSLQSVDEIGYRLHRHDEDRVSSDPALRRASFRMLVTKHRDVLTADRHAFAAMLREHARTCRKQGLRWEAVRWTFSAARHDPVGEMRQGLSRLARRFGR